MAHDHFCPCCGYKTLDRPPPGTFQICSICGWEDDNIQFKDPDYRGGANRPSLRESQRNFLAFGAKEERALRWTRRPDEGDERDPCWRPLE